MNSGLFSNYLDQLGRAGENMLSEESAPIDPTKKDPQFFLRKARFFYDAANRAYEEEDDDDEYEMVPLEIISSNQMKDETPAGAGLTPPGAKPWLRSPAGAGLTVTPKIKPAYGRYYDPTTKHYYKTTNILDLEKKPKPKEPDVWYPENKLSYQYAYDVDTGQYYKVDKIYDADGNYTISYKELDYQPKKRPGTDYYKPNYK